MANESWAYRSLVVLMWPIAQSLRLIGTAFPGVRAWVQKTHSGRLGAISKQLARGKDEEALQLSLEALDRPTRRDDPEEWWWWHFLELAFIAADRLNSQDATANLVSRLEKARPPEESCFAAYCYGRASWYSWQNGFHDKARDFAKRSMAADSSYPWGYVYRSMYTDDVDEKILLISTAIVKGSEEVKAWISGLDASTLSQLCEDPSVGKTVKAWVNERGAQGANAEDA